MSSPDFELSIDINESSKSKHLEEFEELTRRLLESDRNHPLLFKHAELTNLTKNYNNIKLSTESLAQTHGQLEQGLEKKLLLRKELERHYEDSKVEYEQLAFAENELQINSLNEKNQELAVELSGLALQYENAVRKSKERQGILDQIRQKKEFIREKNRINCEIIQELETKAQKSKRRAEELEIEFQKMSQKEIANKNIIERKESELKDIQKIKEEYEKKEEEQKRNIQKIMIKAKKLEENIDVKVEELKKLEKIHENLKKEIENAEKKQNKYEELILKRRELISNAKRCNAKITKEKDENTIILNNI